MEGWRYKTCCRSLGAAAVLIMTGITSGPEGPIIVNVMARKV